MSNMRLKVSKNVHLRPLCIADAGELHSLIERNREYLARWLAWAPTQKPSDTCAFIRSAEKQATATNGFHAVVVCDGTLAGVVSYMEVNWRHRRTILGYWLDADHQGRGLMTGSVRSLVDHALLAWRLNRVEVRVAVGNRKSQAVPERLGFRREATLRQAELINGHYCDSIVYAMLAADWSCDSSQRCLHL